jgi:Putative bacterial sensory transduction regulator
MERLRNRTLKQGVIQAIVVAAAVICVCVPQIRAQDDVAKPSTSQEDISERIYKNITTAQMLAIMDDEGYAVSIDEDGDILWKINGLKTFIIVSGNEEAMLFSSAFSVGNATMEKVNEWNKTKRYSRSYLDDEDDPHLELDLDLAGGVTHARILDYIKTCRVSYVMWCDDVIR